MKASDFWKSRWWLSALLSISILPINNLKELIRVNSRSISEPEELLWTHSRLIIAALDLMDCLYPLTTAEIVYAHHRHSTSASQECSVPWDQTAVLSAIKYFWHTLGSPVTGYTYSTCIHVHRQGDCDDTECSASSDRPTSRSSGYSEVFRYLTSLKSAVCHPVHRQHVPQLR
jgi:hypothetical protein